MEKSAHCWYNEKRNIMSLKVWGFIALLGISIALGGLFLYRTVPASIFSGLSSGAVSESFVPVQYSEGALAIKVAGAKIVSQDEYELAFPLSGTIEEVLATEGTLAVPDTPLLKLETRELALEIKKNKAIFAEQAANLDKLRKGTRLEEVAVYVNKKNSSATALKSQKKEALDAVYDAFVKADDAIRNKTDPLFTTPSTDPQLTFSPSASGLENSIESGRSALEGRLDDWKDQVGGLKATGDIQKYINDAKRNVKSVTEYLDKVALAANSLVAGSISQSTIDEWKVAIIAARTNMSTAASGVSAAETDFKSADKSLNIAQDELNLKVAGTEAEDVEAAVNAALAAKSQIEVTEEHIRQSGLFAPTSGLLVKKIYPKKGEYVAAGTPVAIVAQPALKMQVDIPEEDIRHIQVGDSATLTLSAMPLQKIEGVVSSIEFQEIEKEESVYFRTNIALSPDWEKSGDLRPGMTGDALIFGSGSGKALRIPRSALYVRNGVSYVKALRPSKKIEEMAVQVGAESNGLVQVMAGLSAGDAVASKP